MARIAVATSIAPNELLDAPPEVFWAMVEVLREQSMEMEKAKGRR